MNQNLKRGLIIAGSIGAIIVVGIFIRNKLNERNFKRLSRQDVIKILRKARKQNYILFKKVSLMSNQIAVQMKLSQIDPQMVKNYLESAQSPLKVSQILQKNYAQACNSLGATYDQFNQSLNYYTQKQKDEQIKQLVQECQRDYQVSLSGKVPQIKVSIPANLTIEKLIDIHKQLTLKMYLLQIETYRIIRGKSTQQLLNNPDIMKSIPNPENQQQKILEGYGLGANDQPPSVVYKNALMHHRNDPKLKQAVNKTQSHYLKIFNKYKNKINLKKITQAQLEDYQSQLLYTPM